MPEKSTIRKAKRALRSGKSPTTAAGEFVHEEIKHVREGKHGARSPKQAIAIGLSKARRAGVPVKPPPGSKARRAAKRDTEASKRGGKPRSARRSRATKRALEREPRSTVSRGALSRQARRASRRRQRRSSSGRS